VEGARYHPSVRRAFLLFSLLALSCSSHSDDPPTSSSTATQASFSLDGDFASETTFWDFPWPSDLRLSDKGTPMASAFPDPLGKPLVQGMRVIASERRGWGMMPTGYFKFTSPIGARDPFTTIPADLSSPILLIDVDAKSSERGALIPTVASTLAEDDYVPQGALGVAARPGFVLRPNHQYAFVVRKSLNDASGKPLEANPTFAAILRGETPPGSRGAAAKALYAPLLEVLAQKKIDDAVVATVFTTGDVVADTAKLGDNVVAAYDAKISELAVDPDDGATHPRYCELKGKITYPQFQRGTPPFDKDGLFDIGADGLPKKQRDETVPITINFPKQPMPKGGYPLVVYWHGSGGLSTASVDRGRWHPETDASKCPDGHLDTWEGKTGCNTKGEGPAYVVAEHGLGMASSALPVNPERLPGASEIAYINLGNLAAMRDTFRQGVMEQRLFIESLQTLTVDPSVVSACTGMSLPDGETAFHYRKDRIAGQGQSMGGMYTNLIAASDPKIEIALPTGAGGFWSFFITKTSLYSDGAGLVAGLVGASPQLDFLHPVLSVLELGLEPSDPMVSTPRLAVRPLEGHPVRPIYEPVGKGDSYFPTIVYDAMALAYGNKQSGTEVWPTMQEALALDQRQGLVPYPVSNTLKSETGASYTGVVVQYEGDGIYDPHALYTQLDSVQYQYGCFLATFVSKGISTVPAPAPLGTPCPGL
jgi:hypothetical protein